MSDYAKVLKELKHWATRDSSFEVFQPEATARAAHKAIEELQAEVAEFEAEFKQLVEDGVLE